MFKEKDTGVLSADSVEELQRIYERHRFTPGNTIALLQAIQDHFGYLPEDAVNWMADRFEVPRSKLFGVATFYAQFYLKPRGRNIVAVCCGTACHVKGGTKIAESLRRDLNLGPGEDTTEDLEFTLEEVRCVGACSIAPVVILNNKPYANMTSKRTANLVKKICDRESE